MGYIARLVYGLQEFSLNDSTYSLWTDFVPPAIVNAVNIASGTFRNKSGGKTTGRQPKDREWSFGVLIQGGSSAEVHHAASKLQGFLSLCNDESDTLYLEYQASNAVSYRPLWGQAVYRYEIKSGVAAIWDMYLAADLNTKAMVCPLSLLIGPYAEGLKQPLTSAAGGILEDIALAPDGRSRGLIIPLATTNLVTNPILSAATTSWTANGAGVTVTRKTSGGPIGIAETCAEVYAANVSGAGVIVNSGAARMAVSAGNNYCASIYAKCNSGASYTFIIQIAWYNAGGGQISTSDSGTLTMTGDWARYSFSAVSPALTTTAHFAVLRVATGVHSYLVTGAQFENNSQVEPFCTGDMLGCSWSGTAHASSTNRTAGQVKLPIANNLNLGAGTIVVGFKNGFSSGFGISQFMFQLDSINWRGYFNQADDTWNFGDATNTATSAAVSFSAGDIVILHFTWDAVNGMVVYRNGVSIATSATYTYPTGMGANLWIGSTNAASGQNCGTFLSFRIFDRAMSSGEVALDHADLSQALNGGDGLGQAVNGIPWLWTKDGDNIVDNALSGTTYHNYAVAGGIPGSDAARTGFGMTWFFDNGPVVIDGYLCNVALKTYRNPNNLLFYDLSGTATTAADVGSAVQRTSLTTSEVDIANTAWPTDISLIEAMAGKNFIILGRIRDATSGTVYIKPRMSWSGNNIDGDFTTISTNTAARIFASKGLAFFSRESLMAKSGYLNGMQSGGFALRGYRNSGTNNLDVDYVAIFPAPCLKVAPDSQDENVIYFQGKQGKVAPLITASPPSIKVDANVTLTGQEIELIPGKYNILITQGMQDAANASDIDFTATYVLIDVTPQWALV